MSRHYLICHPLTPARSIESVTADIMDFNQGELEVEFGVKPASTLLIPTLSAPARTDELWKTTCLEVFLRPDGGERYFEFNCSPSTAWAAYRFAAYRENMENLATRRDPWIDVSEAVGHFWLYAELEVACLGPHPSRLGFSAVIEETDGTKSYWALAHPPGPPDFHHPDCFALTLPPPNAPRSSPRT